MADPPDSRARSAAAAGAYTRERLRRILAMYRDIARVEPEEPKWQAHIAETLRSLDDAVTPVAAPEARTNEDGDRVSLDQIEIGRLLPARPVTRPPSGGAHDLEIGASERDSHVGYEELSPDDLLPAQHAKPGPPRSRATPPPFRGVPSQLRNSVDLARLRRIPLLGSLPPEALEMLATRIGRKTFAPGDRVIAEGEAADNVYLVASGDLVATRGAPPRPLARLGEGSFFGEMALLDDTPRSATITAVTDADLLVLPRSLVLEICERYPSVLATMMRSLRSRLIATLSATSPFFSKIPPRARENIVARFRLREIEPHTEFIREGRAADGLYVMLTGRADVTSDGVLLATLTTGDVAGEMSLLSSGVAEASVTAQNWVTALVLTAAELLAIIMAHPVVLTHLAGLSKIRRDEIESARADGLFSARSLRRV